MPTPLQTFFHLSYLRHAVYCMPAGDEDKVTIPLALQRVFYELQYGESVGLSTREGERPRRTALPTDPPSSTHRAVSPRRDARGHVPASAGHVPRLARMQRRA